MEQIDVTYFCKTKAQATDFSTRIAEIMQQLYNTSFNLEKLLMVGIGMQKKDKLVAIMRERNVVMDSRQSLKAFFQEVQDTVAKLPILSLTIAFEPDDATLATLSQWFLLNLKKQVLFDITVNETCIGGAIVSYNGKYHDSSVKELFTKIVHDELAPKEKKAPEEKHQNLDHMHLGR